MIPLICDQPPNPTYLEKGKIVMVLVGGEYIGPFTIDVVKDVPKTLTRTYNVVRGPKGIEALQKLTSDKLKKHEPKGAGK